ncbi:hypothetical protein RVR_7620 [Actinacidiphila reveromycinica]|uniref:Lipoprotein n=1 Tax=Actinacidiphila reveromycinica TaxID=659352 RepID=A0A7U3VR64_9ACTN|nr:hypothetical protein [Streptomyces sp. SN-593]BBB00521.1 hypothetical protein RVR_7620 [Streptomyces sp. SN-593]
MIPKLTRRGAVAMATAGVLAGCSGGRGRASAATRSDSAQAALQAREVRDSAALLARYDAAIAARPELSARLAPLRADTAAHVRAFGGRPAAAPPSASASAPASDGGGTDSPTPAGSSSAPTAPLAALAAAERALADRRARTLLDAPGALARLLASVAAAGAGHVVLLGSPAGK